MIKDDERIFNTLTNLSSAQRELTFCCTCGLYPCELVNEYLFFKKKHPLLPKGENHIISYDRRTLKKGCDIFSECIIQIKCGDKRVSEGIGEHYKIKLTKKLNIKKNTEDRWEPSQPVFISAQTGKGAKIAAVHPRAR